MPAIEPTVSIIIPCFNEEGSLHELYMRIRTECVQLQLRTEIIFIDDGSRDGTRALLREIAINDADCRVIAFRRNCGKATALHQGFQIAQGEFIIIMDADLQDDPQEIPRFLDALQRVDVVAGWKATRHDPPGKTIPSRLFNAIVRAVTGIPLHDANCGFKGFRRQVIKEITLYGELHRYIPVLAAARGFRIEELAVTHHPRQSGVSKYGWERFLRGFFDLCTVIFITKYRMRPLHLFGTIGIGFLLIAIIFSIALSALYAVVVHQPGLFYFLLMMVTISLYTLGPIFFAIGLLAEGHLATTFHQEPAPPIDERINITGNGSTTNTNEGVHAS